MVIFNCGFEAVALLIHVEQVTAELSPLGYLHASLMIGTIDCFLRIWESHQLWEDTSFLCVTTESRFWDSVFCRVQEESTNTTSIMTRQAVVGEGAACLRLSCDGIMEPDERNVHRWCCSRCRTPYVKGGISGRSRHADRYTNKSVNAQL
eukprot:g11553.t1